MNCIQSKTLLLTQDLAHATLKGLLFSLGSDSILAIFFFFFWGGGGGMFSSGFVPSAM